MINPGVYANQLNAPQNVASAVKNASARTGVDFSYLLKQAKVESSFDTDVKAKGSSATGLFQFIDQTWLGMVKEHGAEHGKAAWADAIVKNRDGSLSVKNGMRSEILNGRKDAQFSSLMAAEFASENKAHLESKLNRTANATDLYMAHFLGAGGASEFLSAMDSNPSQKASVMFPSAAQSNRNVFFNADGSARTLAEVYGKFDTKFSEAGNATSGSDSRSVMFKNAPQNTYAYNPAMEMSDPTLATPARLAALDEPRNNEPSGFSNPFAAAYNMIKTPIQTMIGNDLLASPLLSLFTSDRADQQLASRGEKTSFFSEKRDEFGFNS